MLLLHATPTRAAPVLVLDNEDTDHGHTRTAEKRGPSVPSDMEASPTPGTLSRSLSKPKSRSPMTDLSTYKEAPRHQHTFARRVAPAVTRSSALTEEARRAHVQATLPLQNASASAPAPPSPVRSLLDAYLGTSPLPRRPASAPPGSTAGETGNEKGQSSPTSTPLSGPSASFHRSPAPPRAYIEEFLALSDDSYEETSVSPAPQRRAGTTLDHSPVVQEMWNETSSSSSSSSVSSLSTAVSDGFAAGRAFHERRESPTPDVVAHIDLGCSASPESPRPVSLTAPRTRGQMLWSATAQQTREAAPNRDDKQPPHHQHQPRRSLSVERTLRFAPLAEITGGDVDSDSDTVVSEGHALTQELTPPPSPRRGRDAQRAAPRIADNKRASSGVTSPAQLPPQQQPHASTTTQSPSPLHTSRFQPPPMPASPPRRTPPRRIPPSASASSTGAPPPAPAQLEVVKPLARGTAPHASRGSDGSGAHASASDSVVAAPSRPSRPPPALVVPVEVAPGVTRSLLVNKGDSATAAVGCFLDVYAASFHLDRRVVAPPLVQHVATHMAGPSGLSRKLDKKPNIKALLARLYPKTGASTRRDRRDASPPEELKESAAARPLTWRLSTKVHYNPRTQALEVDDGEVGQHDGPAAHTRHDSRGNAVHRAGSAGTRRSGSAPPPKAPLHTRTSLLRLEATAARQTAEAALRAELEAPSFHPAVAPRSARICQEKLRELSTGKATCTSTTAPTTTTAENADGERGTPELSAADGRQGRRIPTVMAPESDGSTAFWGDAVAIPDVSRSSSEDVNAGAAAPQEVDGRGHHTHTRPQLRQFKGAPTFRQSKWKEAVAVPLLAGTGSGARTRDSAVQTHRNPEESTTTASAEATRVDAATQSLSPYARSIEGAASQRNASASPRFDFSPTSLIPTDLSAFSTTPSTVEKKTMPRVDLYDGAGEPGVDPTGAPLGSSDRQQRIEERLLALDADRRRRLAATGRFAGARDTSAGQQLFTPFTGR